MIGSRGVQTHELTLAYWVWLVAFCAKAEEKAKAIKKRAMNDLFIVVMYR